MRSHFDAAKAIEMCGFSVMTNLGWKRFFAQV